MRRGGPMSKLEAKYVPIGTKLDEEKPINTGKTLKEIEEEAKAAKSKPVADLKNTNLSGPKVESALLAKEEKKPKPLGGAKIEEEKPKPLGGAKIVEPKIEPLTAKKPKEEVTFEAEEPEEIEEELDLFDPSFLKNLSELEVSINDDIKNGKIKLIITNADQNLNNIEDSFDDAFGAVASNVNYDIKDEKAIRYSQEIAKAAAKLERLEQTIDQMTYQSELRLNEFEESKLRETRYRKRKFEGLDEIGGIEGKDHRTDEKNIDIDVKKNTDFSNEQGMGSSRKDIPARERRGGEDVVERRAFVQDYEGSDLEGIDKERDRLEQEILKKQEAEEKANKKKSKKKTEEEKIAEAKERLRKKQEKRKAKQQKKTEAKDIDEIDLVGNQFDIDELREERMDRLLEIKKLSAEKKELQKQKEKQRSKATKEFYKYKKVNKKSHIVGFKQQ